MDYERARLSDGRIKPPFTSPDCPYRQMNSASEVPENAVEFGKLRGQPVYLGRVYDDECWLVGTAIPSESICKYLSRKGEVKSADSYEILTSDCGNPLEFRPADFESNLIFVAAGDQDACLYAARVLDGEDTYIGWVDESEKVAYIPRETSNGPNSVKDNYDVLIHKFLDRLCICPMAPPHSY